MCIRYQEKYQEDKRTGWFSVSYTWINKKNGKYVHLWWWQFPGLIKIAYVFWGKKEFHLCCSFPLSVIRAPTNQAKGTPLPLLVVWLMKHVPSSVYWGACVRMYAQLYNSFRWNYVHVHIPKLSLFHLFLILFFLTYIYAKHNKINKKYISNEISSGVRGGIRYNDSDKG